MMCMARPCDIDPPNTGIQGYSQHREILRNRGSCARAPANGGIALSCLKKQDAALPKK